MLPGLHHLASIKLQQAGWNLTKLREPHTDPRIAHEAETTAHQLETEAAALQQHIQSNQELIHNIELLIHYLHHSPHKSAYRTLALRDLEQAADRLLRELGPPPSN